MAGRGMRDIESGTRPASARAVAHRPRLRRRTLLVPVVLIVGSVLSIVGHSPALARHNYSMLEVSPQQATSGQDVIVSGFSYTKTAVIRFGALDGPVLARLEPTANNDIRGVVRIPPDVRPGRYVLYAMHENEQGKPTRFPGRAALVVSGPGGPPIGVGQELALEARPVGVLERDSVPGKNLLFAAVATAGAGSLVAGTVLVLIGRRRNADVQPS